MCSCGPNFTIALADFLHHSATDYYDPLIPTAALSALLLVYFNIYQYYCNLLI